MIQAPRPFASRTGEISGNFAANDGPELVTLYVALITDLV
jgi:hypothetical protein